MSVRKLKLIIDTREIKGVPIGSMIEGDMKQLTAKAKENNYTYLVGCKAVWANHPSYGYMKYCATPIEDPRLKKRKSSSSGSGSSS